MELLNLLKNYMEGHDIYIYTARDEEDDQYIWYWLNEHTISSHIKDIVHEKLPIFSIFIDDRAINFSGIYPDMKTINTFQPWYHNG